MAAVDFGRCWIARRLPLAAVSLAVVAMLAPASAADGPPSVADLVAPLLDAVVNISTSQTVAGAAEGDQTPTPGPAPAPQGPGGVPFQNYFDQFFGQNGGTPDSRPQRVQSLGSGFVIDSSGLIVTNNHVIDGADEITANFSDGTKLTATLVGHDDKTDLALLRVKPPKPLTAVKFGDSATMRVGDWVMAIGNPFGLGGTVTVGILSARNRDINSGPYDDFLQTDAAINRGNSGGPLFDKEGEVIGINTAIISPTGGSIGLGFAIPTEIVVGIIDQLRQSGSIKRGWLGVRIQDVTDDVAADLSAPTKGALVAGVDESGPAKAGGIVAGDIIVALDGKPIDAMHALPRIVAEEAVGKVVSVDILRDGKPQTLSVTIGLLKEVAAAPATDNTKDSKKGDGDTSNKAAPPDAAPPVAPDALGLTLAPLSPELRTKYGIKSEVAGGVVVTAVQAGSTAEDKRLQAGDIISMVGDQLVTSPDEVERQIVSLKKDGRANARLVVQNKDGNVRWVNLPIPAE
ncbi:MAG TPA: Do family serine endopeptidase [Bauldia sp.]